MSFSSNIISYGNYLSGSITNTKFAILQGTVNAPASQTAYTVSSIVVPRNLGRFYITDIRYRLISQVGASASDRNYRMRRSVGDGEIHASTSPVTFNGAINTIPGAWWCPVITLGQNYLAGGDSPVIRDGLSSFSATSYILSIMLTGFYVNLF